MDKNLDRDPGSEPAGAAAARAQRRSSSANVPEAGRRRGFGRFVLHLVSGLFLLLFLAIAAVAFVFSQGPVSSEELRTQMESTLRDILGADFSATIGEAKVAMGEDGLFALSASGFEVQSLKHPVSTTVEAARLQVRAMPLLKGQLVAEKLVLDGIRLPLDRLLDDDGEPADLASLTSGVDLKALARTVGTALGDVLDNLQENGLQSIVLKDVGLEGFARFGLRSQSASLPLLELKRTSDGSGSFDVSGEFVTDRATWPFRAEWRPRLTGGMELVASISGLDTDEFLWPAKRDEYSIGLKAPVTVAISAPYAPDGEPQQATISIGLGSGRIATSIPELTTLRGGQLNFRTLPEVNQIELERSPVEFAESTANLIGGFRFPAPGDETSQPLFEIIANDIRARGMDTGAGPVAGGLQISGVIDQQAQAIRADTILLKTPDGRMEGSGRLVLGGDSPALLLDLKIPEMDVASFKQFWPPFLAPGARRWVEDGLQGGVVRNAWVAANIPAGILGNLRFGEKIADDHLVAEVPVSGTSVRTTGDLPRISDATGTVFYRGMETRIVLQSGTMAAQNGTVAIERGEMKIGDFTLEPLPSTMSLEIGGPAAAVAALGATPPLKVTGALGVKPSDLDGKVSGTIRLAFPLQDDLKIEQVDWTASLKTAGLSSKSKLLGYDISDGDFEIDAKPGVARIDGSARVDGMPARLALVEPFGDGSKVTPKRDVTLVLDDAARKKLGIDTAGILSGPVSLKVNAVSKGRQKIDADLTAARINFPWAGWSKGRGIQASASFTLERLDGLERITQMKFKGPGFGASGSLEVVAGKLRSAQLRDVVLNKNDRINVDITRSKSGFDIAIAGDSYDARAIIQSVLDEGKTAQGGKDSPLINIIGTFNRLRGFNGQSLTDVSLKYSERSGRILNAELRGIAPGAAPTLLSIKPEGNTVKTGLATANAGDVLRFLDLYVKMNGGRLEASVARDASGVYRGTVSARDFTVIDEPRLKQLLTPPRGASTNADGEEVFRQIEKVETREARVERLSANVEKGNGFLRLQRGRLRGGDMAATFEGTVFDRNNRMNIKGTFLPAYGLNNLVSKIPIIGLAFGRGKVNGLIGITFRLTGSYRKPTISVNPISLFAPGVFRKIFEF